MDKMIIEIDSCICDEYVYQVTVKVEAGKQEGYYQTTFNKKQPETAINRAIKAIKIERHLIKKIKVTMLQKLGFSQIK